LRREKTSVSQEDYLKAIWEMLQEDQTPISARLAEELVQLRGSIQSEQHELGVARAELAALPVASLCAMTSIAERSAAMPSAAMSNAASLICEPLLRPNGIRAT